MSEQESPNKNKDINPDILIGIMINTPPVPVPDPDDKPLDRVKPPTDKKRCREHER